MTRAEQAALKAYPKSDFNGVESRRKGQRKCFIQGYEQAEKDLALTWEDVYSICYLFLEIARSTTMKRLYLDPEELCGQILLKFNENKEKNNE